MCWASPKNSREKVLCFTSSATQTTRFLPEGCGAAGAHCSSGLWHAAGAEYVAIDDPIPEAREAYLREGLTYHQGIGLAHDLPQDYDEDSDEASENDH